MNIEPRPREKPRWDTHKPDPASPNVQTLDLDALMSRQPKPLTPARQNPKRRPMSSLGSRPKTAPGGGWDAAATSPQLQQAARTSSKIRPMSSMGVRSKGLALLPASPLPPHASDP